MAREHLEQKIRDMEDPYALVVATAREARRINAIFFHSGGNKDETEKVTTDALRRMVHGEVEWLVGDMKPTDVTDIVAATGGKEGQDHFHKD